MIGGNLTQNYAKVTKLPPFKIGLIGGTDSSNGSGLRADLQTVEKMNCHAIPAISAITLQNNPQNVRIFPVSPDGLNGQLSELLKVDLHAIKIGMLPDRSSVQIVCDFLDAIPCPKVVLDPVHSTSSGHRLITKEGWDLLLENLLPRVGLVTPNLDEVVHMLGKEFLDETNPVKLLNQWIGSRTKAILLKGGHNPTEWCTDLLLEENKSFLEFKRKYINGGGQVRGTGCRLATAIACFWAKGNTLGLAVEQAGKYLHEYILQKVR